MLDALRYLGDDDGGRYVSGDLDGNPGKQLTVVLNQVPDKRSGDWRVIQWAFHRAGIRRRVALPNDPQLRLMLDSATYSLEALRRPTRGPIKELAVEIAEALV